MDEQIKSKFSVMTISERYEDKLDDIESIFNSANYCKLLEEYEESEKLYSDAVREINKIKSLINRTDPDMITFQLKRRILEMEINIGNERGGPTSDDKKELDDVLKDTEECIERMMDPNFIGSKVWEHIFPECVKGIPVIPKEITKDLLNMRCPISGYENKIKDTHILIAMPAEVMESRITIMEWANVLLKKAGYDTESDKSIDTIWFYEEPFAKYNVKPRWLLIPKISPPETSGYSYQDQEKYVIPYKVWGDKMISKLERESGEIPYSRLGYTTIRIEDAVTAMLMYHMHSNVNDMYSMGPVWSSTVSLKKSPGANVGIYADSKGKLTISYSTDLIFKRGLCLEFE